jgi:polar amino acid transport system ATP-binding protein
MSNGWHTSVDSGSCGLALRIRGLTKRYGATVCADAIDLDLTVGSKTVLIGPSGSGKSSLLRLIDALEHPDAGTIDVFGQRISVTKPAGRWTRSERNQVRQGRTKIGIVFQNFNLFPHRTALQNVMEGPVYVLKRNELRERARALQLLAGVGLQDHADKYPRQLSGGQQQRVAIARALAMEPRLMLFDEVTSALDPEIAGEVLEVIERLARDSGMTMLIVTHEMRFARAIAERVIVMEHGRIIDDDEPSTIFTAPTNPRTKEFLRAVSHY